jgi:phosphoglycerate kinase
MNNQRVLMRVDFNVPLSPQNTLLDDTKIRAALPSIRFVLQKGASLILMSHLGRPEGKKDPNASLAPCAKRLAELLEQPVPLAPDCVGSEVEQMAQRLHPGSLLMLENLRFHKGEEEPDKDPTFVQALAQLGTLYVNDAFGTAHRTHASTALIAHFFPHKAAMGFLMEKEIQALSPLLHNPKRPYFVLIGGAKVSSKVGVITRLLDQLDALFLGGAMAFPFLKAQKRAIGASKCDEQDVLLAQQILQKAESLGRALHLPLDLVAAKENEIQIFTKELPPGWSGKDIGPATVHRWKSEFFSAKTVFWNGPLGVYETPPFDRGTHQIAAILAQSKGAVIVGGGDSVAAIEKMGYQDRFAHLSTGGGASLEFLEFGHLPGIDALSDIHK